MSVDLAERGESPAASECPHVDVLLLWRRREVGVGSLEKLFNCERTRGKKHSEIPETEGRWGFLIVLRASLPTLIYLKLNRVDPTHQSVLIDPAFMAT